MTISPLPIIADVPLLFTKKPLANAGAYHQQYLAKNLGGYCGLGGTGWSCPVTVANVD